MGSCGCGDYAGEFKLPGPDGITYVIQRYAGCLYCMNPAGVIVYKMGIRSAADWNTSALPELPMHSYDRAAVDSEAFIPIANASEFVKGLKPWFEGQWKEYFSLSHGDGEQLVEMLKDGLGEHWVDIIHASMEREPLLEVKKSE